MATISKRGEKQWQAKVRMKGYPPLSRTFDYKADAEKWAMATERELQTAGFVDRREAEKTPLVAVLRRYAKEITPQKKGAEAEAVRIEVMLRDPVLSHLKMAALTSATLAEWRDRRRQEVSGASVAREMTILSAVINHARREWNITIENPLPYVKRPAPSKSRERRLMSEEEAYLLAALEPATRQPSGIYSKGGTRNPWLRPLVRFALETAMRRGELLALDWHHVDLNRQVAHLPDTKNGEARNVPLSSAAVAILKDMPRNIAGPVFPTTPMALRLGFERATKRAAAKYLADCEAAGRKPAPGFLEDLHFHDLRHEATSRLADKLANVLELAAVTGHKNLQMLKRYYHPKAEDLAKKLG